MNRLRHIVAASAALALTSAAPALATDSAPNDLIANASFLGNGSFASSLYDVAGSGDEAGEPSIGDSGQTIWFKWTPTGSGAVFADTCEAGDDDNRVRAYRRTNAAEPVAVTNLTPAAAGQADLPSSSPCKYRWRAAEGTTYWIQVEKDGNSGNGALLINQDKTTPVAPTLAPSPAVTGPTGVATFSHPESNAVFRCSIDDDPFAPCTSPWAWTLAGGKHTIGVRARDAHGNLGPIVQRTWTVDAPLTPADVDEPILPTEQGPGGGSTAQQGGTTPPRPAVCRLTVATPKRVRRAKVRKGVRVRVTAADAACVVELSGKLRGRRLAKRSKVVAAGTTRRFVVKGKRARRGKLTLVVRAGDTVVRRTIRVR